MASTMIAGWSMLGADDFFNLLLISAVPVVTVMLPAVLQTVFAHQNQ